MDEDYYSYTKKFMSRWANIFYLGEIFISGSREKVVDFTNAKNGLKILDVCTGAGGQAFAFAKRGSKNLLVKIIICNNYCPIISCCFKLCFY